MVKFTNFYNFFDFFIEIAVLDIIVLRFLF